MNNNVLRAAIVQISPIYLDKKATWEKLKTHILEAIENGAELIVWGETLIPGYPQWVSETSGAKFNDPIQKQLYHKYWEEAVSIDDPIVEDMKQISKKFNVMLIGGILEKATSSVYATCLTIGNGELFSRHRKIKPTYEERLVWSDGDAKGLTVHETKIGKVGSLNCWENWLPLARAYLHKLGEIVHVAVWPGSIKLTKHISRFIAMEGRSWVLSASGLLRGSDFEHLSEEEFPVKKEMMGREFWQNGGSMFVHPNGKVIGEPLIDKEGIIYADLDSKSVVMERQMLDISGHYSRFDIFDLSIKK